MNMATPTTPEQFAMMQAAFADYMEQQRATVRELYGQWVSGLEPLPVYGSDPLGGLKGLCVAGDPTHTLVVKNPDWRPGFLDMLYKNL